MPCHAPPDTHPERRLTADSRFIDNVSPAGNTGNACTTFRFEWVRETDLLTCSPERAALLGTKTPAALSWREHLENIPEPDRDRLTNILAGLTPDRPSYCTSYRYLTKGQRTLILEERGWAVFDESGRLARRLGITDDVSDRKQAEADLRQNEKHLRLALAAARGGTWCLYPESGACLFSKEARELLHLPPDAPSTLQAVLGKVFAHDRPRVKARIEAAIRDVAPCHAEFRISLSDGGFRWLAARAEPCAATGQDTLLLGLVQDISERKFTEESLRAADRRKDQFLAMLAHELRNPLTPVRNAAEILRSVDTDDPRLRDAIRIIDRQSTHMERLIEDLLDVARISQGRLNLKRERAALSDILNQAIELTRHRFEERRQKLDVRLCPASVRLRCDPVRICQVVANLLDNASKFTDEGGEIRLRARIEGSEAHVRISDSGRGISPEELPFLFDGLARERPRPAPPLAGLGLGLSIVKRLVCMHDGNVSASSPGIGRGSCFTVRLPLEQKPEPIPDDRPPAETAMAPARLRILVVDDDQDVAESTAVLLRSMGYGTDVASTGEDALRRAREGIHRLVLLDIGLADSDGLEVARRLRQLHHGRDIRIVAVTGHGDPQTRRDARAAGIDRHLLKPLSPDALRELIGSLRD